MSKDSLNDSAEKEKLDKFLAEGNHVLCWVWHLNKCDKFIKIVIDKRHDSYLTMHRNVYPCAEICTDYSNFPDGVLGKLKDKS